MVDWNQQNNIKSYWTQNTLDKWILLVLMVNSWWSIFTVAFIDMACFKGMLNKMFGFDILYKKPSGEPQRIISWCTVHSQFTGVRTLMRWDRETFTATNGGIVSEKADRAVNRSSNTEQINIDENSTAFLDRLCAKQQMQPAVSGPVTSGMRSKCPHVHDWWQVRTSGLLDPDTWYKNKAIKLRWEKTQIHL